MKDKIEIDKGLNSDVQLLLGPGVVGHLYYNKFIDLVVLYNLKGKLINIRADEKFERIS